MGILVSKVSQILNLFISFMTQYSYKNDLADFEKLLFLVRKMIWPILKTLLKNHFSKTINKGNSLLLNQIAI